MDMATLVSDISGLSLYVSTQKPSVVAFHSSSFSMLLTPLNVIRNPASVTGPCNAPSGDDQGVGTEELGDAVGDTDPSTGALEGFFVGDNDGPVAGDFVGSSVPSVGDSVGVIGDLVGFGPSTGELWNMIEDI